MRQHFVTIRADDSEIDFINSLAKRAGVGRSILIRRAIEFYANSQDKAPAA